MKRILAPLCIVLVATSYAQDAAGPQREVTLDLVSFRDVPAIERSENPNRGVMLDHRKAQPELSAELLPLERGEFSWGDEFEFQLRVKNVGSIAITLPWAADGLVPEESDHATAHVQRALALIEIESLDGKRQLGQLDGFPLAGAVTIPGSLQRLAPGATALLRVPARWSSITTDVAVRVLGEANGQVRVRGSLALFETSTRATSANAQTVVVVKRQ